MKSRALACAAVAVAIAFVFCVGPVSAEPMAADLLYKDGSITELEDNDWESIQDGVAGTPAVIDAGDIFFGMFAVTDVYNATLGGLPRDRQAEMFTGVFVAKVASVASSAFGSTITLMPAAQAEWTALGLGTLANPGTTIMLYSDPDGPQNMVDPGTGNVISSLATAINGTKLWEFGFAGESGEGWVVQYNALFGYLTQGSLNVTAATPAVAGLTLQKHNYLGVVSGGSQIQFQGFSESGFKGDFSIRTDTDFYLQAVPEPSVMILLLGGLLAVGTALARRRGR